MTINDKIGGHETQERVGKKYHYIPMKHVNTNIKEISLMLQLIYCHVLSSIFNFEICSIKRLNVWFFQSEILLYVNIIDHKNIILSYESFEIVI